MEIFQPMLCSANFSDNFMNPRETLWITLIWKANIPSKKDCHFFIDIQFGHQRTPENKKYHFRVTGDSIPAATQWQQGDKIAVSLAWHNLSDWSGTYELYAGIIDNEGCMIPFIGHNGSCVLRQQIGSVDIGWNLGRPWVAAHRRPFTAVINHAEDDCQKPSIKASITIEDELSVRLSSDKPEILGYLISGMQYEVGYAVPRLLLRNRKSGELFHEGEKAVHVVYKLSEHNILSAEYHCEALVNDITAVSYRIGYSVIERTLTVSVLDIQEKGVYELLSIEFHAFTQLQRGFLIDFFGSGRLIPIAEARPMFYKRRYDVRNAAVLYDENIMMIVESAHMDSLLTTGIVNINAQNFGVIGGDIVIRVPAKKPGLESIRVSKPPVFTIEVPELAGKNPDWTLAAALLRRGIIVNSAHDMYRNSYIYKQLVTYGPRPPEEFKLDSHPSTQALFKSLTFEEVIKNVRGFSNMTDGARQVIYIAGWQDGGFDEAFPRPYAVDARCGDIEGLRSAIIEIRQYNAICGLHDNFDDISYSNAKNFPYAAIDENGEPWRGWIWAGGLTNIMGFHKYAKSGEMRARIKKMNELLPLKDTYHIDVLTAEPCRYDFDQVHPASAEDNFLAKMIVVDEFAQYGIDVTSEMLTHKAVGKIGYALHTRLDTEDIFIPGERFIPLVQMIYHGIIGYSAPSQSIDQLLWGLLLGAHTFYEENITGELCISRFYIQNVPAMLLYDAVMTGFTQNGDIVRADYGSKSYVEVDFKRKKYRVVADDILIGKDFSTFYHGNKGYIAYSFDGALNGFKIPETMQNAKVTLTELTPEGDGEAWYAETNGDIFDINIKPMTPVRISI